MDDSGRTPMPAEQRGSPSFESAGRARGRADTDAAFLQPKDVFAAISGWFRPLVGI
jgi:hypothetical protein